MGSISFVVSLVVTSDLDISWQKSHLGFYLHINPIEAFSSSLMSILEGCVNSDGPSSDGGYGLLLRFLMIIAGWCYKYFLSHFPVNILTHRQNLIVGLDGWGNIRPYFIPG